MSWPNWIVSRVELIWSVARVVLMEVIVRHETVTSTTIWNDVVFVADCVAENSNGYNTFDLLVSDSTIFASF